MEASWHGHFAGGEHSRPGGQRHCSLPGTPKTCVEAGVVCMSERSWRPDVRSSVLQFIAVQPDLHCALSRAWHGCHWMRGSPGSWLVFAAPLQVCGLQGQPFAEWVSFSPSSFFRHMPSLVGDVLLGMFLFSLRDICRGSIGKCRLQ